MLTYASWLHHLKSGSTSNPLHATPSGIMEPESDISDKFITITVNVKATAEITIKTEQVEVQMHNDGRTVKDLVKYALEIEEDPTSLAKVTRQSDDNAEINLNTALNTFPGGTVLDISK